jgi:hypothetical protein
VCGESRPLVADCHTPPGTPALGICHQLIFICKGTVSQVCSGSFLARIRMHKQKVLVQTALVHGLNKVSEALSSFKLGINRVRSCMVCRVIFGDNFIDLYCVFCCCWRKNYQMLFPGVLSVPRKIQLQITVPIQPVCCVHCPFNKCCVLACTAASCRTSPLLCHSLASFTASKAGSGLLGSSPFQKNNYYFAKNVTLCLL